MAEDAGVAAFFSGSDAFGLYARVSVDPSVYSEVAVLKTAYWFTDQYYLFIAKDKANGLLDVEFRLKEGGSPEKLKAACGEFSNYLLDQELRQQVLKETSGIRDTLVKKAFFEAKASLPAGVTSNETHLPKADDRFAQDPVGAGRAG